MLTETKLDIGAFGMKVDMEACFDIQLWRPVSRLGPEGIVGLIGP